MSAEASEILYDESVFVFDLICKHRRYDSSPPLASQERNLDCLDKAKAILIKLGDPTYVTYALWEVQKSGHKYNPACQIPQLDQLLSRFVTDDASKEKKVTLQYSHESCYDRPLPQQTYFLQVQKLQNVKVVTVKVLIKEDRFGASWRQRLAGMPSLSPADRAIKQFSESWMKELLGPYTAQYNKQEGGFGVFEAFFAPYED